jgi:hypothetical protein
MKTSVLLKTSLGLLLTIIVIIGIMEIIEKQKLKECISRQSVRCPRFTCPVPDLTENGGCGSRPHICPPGEDTCGPTDMICIGYCNGNLKNKCYA